MRRHRLTMQRQRDGISRTRCRGFSEESGFWKMICTSRRYAVIARGAPINAAAKRISPVKG